MDEKHRNDNKNERSEHIPAGVYEDVETLNQYIDEIVKLKADKQYEQASEKLTLILEKKILPPTIKQKLIWESVDIYLEMGQYTEALEWLRFLKEMGTSSNETVKDIEYRILHIVIIKELLRKNNKTDVPWSMIPRLILHQADQEMDKVLPRNKQEMREKITAANDQMQVAATEEEGLSRNKRIVEADKDMEKKDRFWMVAVAVIVVAVVIGFMLAMSYLSKTSDSTNATLNINNQAELTNSGDTGIVNDVGTETETDKDAEKAMEEMEYETITTEIFFTAGEWHFIQANAYSNLDIAMIHLERFIEAGFYAELITEDSTGPALLIVFAGTSYGQSKSMLDSIKENADFKVYTDMYVLAKQARSETMKVEGRSIDEEALSLFGERMTGYLRLVSDTSLYLLEETDSDKRADATRELLNTANQIREQVDRILIREKNQEYQTLKDWQEELNYFTDQFVTAEERESLSLQLQEHLFHLLAPQIW